MLTHLIASYLIFCAGLAVLQSIDQTLRKKEAMNWPGFFLFASNAALLFHYGLYVENWADDFRHLAWLFGPAALTIGPANLLYFRQLVEYDKLPRRQWLHILPALAALIVCILAQSVTPAEQAAEQIRLLAASPMHSVLSIPLLLAGLHILGYLTYLAISLHRLVARGAKSAELLLVAFWSYTALLVVLLIYLGFFSASVLIFAAGALMQSSGMIGLFFARNRFPDFFDQLKLQYREKKYGFYALKGVDTAQIRTRLEQLMRDEELYLQSPFTIQDLAARLKLTRTKLSQFLNEQMAMDFRNYVNSWRVQHATNLMRADPSLPVLRVCFDSGFETKSAFQEAFRKFVGKNPKEFKKSLGQASE